jgi:hypothetical protein
MSTQAPPKARPRPPRFDPDLYAVSPAAQALVRETVRALDSAEAHLGLRKRKRRASAQRSRDQQVDALVSNISYQHISGHDAIRVSLRKNELGLASRYRAEGMTEQFPQVIERLSKHTGLIEVTKGIFAPFPDARRQTELAASQWMLTRIEERGLTLLDFDRRPPPELVLLRGEKVNGASAELVEYDETEWTTKHRAEVRTINVYLRQANIEYVGDSSQTGYLVDDRNRYLRRIFTRDSFTSGGRLYGGFWQPLGKSDRLTNVLLNDEPVVSLDYGSMIAHIAYAYVGKTPPEADAYRTRFQGRECGEAVEVSRGTSKKLFSAMLFAASPLKQWPRDLQGQQHRLPVSTVIAGICHAHPGLVPLFFRGLGHMFQFSESEILMDVMLQLIAKDIPALPVHDCVVVPESTQDVAKQIMEDTFRFHQRGFCAPVKIERTTD